MLLFVYSTTIFIASFLLFLIQPMIAKVILPYLGGSPMVWNTAMLFFQTVLLLGYIYAHLTARLLPPKRQAMVHAGVVLASLLLLPVGLHALSSTDPSTSPLLWMLRTLGMSVGVPYFLLSANATLTQHWFAHTGHPAARNPYMLYVTSNIASFAGLLSFPLIIEPTLDFSNQGRFWSGLYVLFACFLCASVALLLKNGGNSALSADSVAAGPAPSWKQKGLWLCLAFLPSSLLQGVNMHIITDVASLPLLWVVPLSIYLLSFVIAFSRFGSFFSRFFWKIAPVVIACIMILIVLRIGSMIGMAAHLACFFILATACHSQLAGKRPAPQFLTGYYLWIALGGMLGGVFNSLIAPMLFLSIIEYPLVLAAVCLFVPLAQPLKIHPRDLMFPLAFMVQILILGSIYSLGDHFMSKSAHALAQKAIFFILVCGFIFQILSSNQYPVRQSLLAMVFVFIMPIFVLNNTGQTVVYAERNFFGLLRVHHNTGYDINMLTHGTTLHGLQSFDKTKRLEPQSYYSPLAGVRDALFKETETRPFAIIGLGTGTLACIGRKEESFDLYEINPAVIHIAENPEYFTYLRDCPPKKNIILGDARLKLDSIPDRSYGMIVIDAYNSDSLPLHLLTRQAVQLYRSKLAPGGVLLFHVTNRHLNLEPVLGTLAKDAGLAAMVLHFNPPKEQKLYFPSRWVAMAEDPATLQPLSTNTGWKPLPAGEGQVWTDLYSNILEAILARKHTDQ